uniref:Uncharacterized protein n=1 Tax=Chrysotila carterae TaxID=13221 RepID=A0A7S4F793_CHRCT
MGYRSASPDSATNFKSANTPVDEDSSRDETNCPPCTGWFESNFIGVDFEATSRMLRVDSCGGVQHIDQRGQSAVRVCARVCARALVRVSLHAGVHVCACVLA